MADSAEYPTDPADPNLLEKIFNASLKRREKEPLKNIVEIWNFFNNKFPKEMYPLNNVKG